MPLGNFVPGEQEGPLLDTQCFAGPRDIGVELAAGYCRGGVIARAVDSHNLRSSVAKLARSGRGGNEESGKFRVGV